MLPTLAVDIELRKIALGGGGVGYLEMCIT